MLSWLCKNSKAIYTRIYEDFHTSPIRVVLRDTQDYHNFLDFSTHPSCMVDYIEREKYLKIFGAIHLSLPKLLCMKLPHYIDMTFRTFIHYHIPRIYIFGWQDR